MKRVTPFYGDAQKNKNKAVQVLK